MNTIALMWDIRGEDSRPYMEFVRCRYLPVLDQLGLARQEVLFRLAGDAPENFTVLEAESQLALERAITSPEWRSLMRELDEYVENFTQCDVTAPPRALR